MGWFWGFFPHISKCFAAPIGARHLQLPKFLLLLFRQLIETVLQLGRLAKRSVALPENEIAGTPKRQWRLGSDDCPNFNCRWIFEVLSYFFRGLEGGKMIYRIAVIVFVNHVKFKGCRCRRKLQAAKFGRGWLPEHQLSMEKTVEFIDQESILLSQRTINQKFKFHCSHKNM